LANGSPAAVLKDLSALFQTGTAAGVSDGPLLDRFRNGTADEAEAAFAALVERHGPMVLHVCRRTLGNRHDAEDAAQAVFLVLARQARSVRRTDSLAGWLYGVATRTAARARLDAARRRVRERRGAEAKAVRCEGGDGPDGSETWAELYQELARLPERFRLPVLLCHLEGLTHEQAARRLGCPVRTVQSRLGRARERLRERLTRRGVGPSVATLAAALTPNAASAAVSQGWTHATVRAAVRVAAGGPIAVDVPNTTAALAEGVSQAMFLQRLAARAAALLLVSVVAGGIGLGVRTRSAPPEPARPADDNGRYRASFHFGESVEVVGVSTVPTGPKTWWKPDGTPLAEAPVDTIGRKTEGPDGDKARVILLRSSGLKPDDLIRWNPTPTAFYWGGRPAKDGRDAPGLEYYEAVFTGDPATGEVRVRLAAGPWKTEVSNDGRGGVGQFVNGRKFSFGRARPYESRGQSMTVFSVAHNRFGHDRRIVAVGRDGKDYPAVTYSAGSDGDEKWVIDLIDAEFPLPPDQIREFRVQFRPFEDVTIKGVALHPRPSGPAAPR